VLLMVADRFLIIGIVMAAVCLISWVTVPIVRFVRYLATDSRLDRVRTRAIAVTAGAAAVILILLGVIPFPNGFRAPGVVKAAERSQVVNETAGAVDAILAKSGVPVKRGQPLLRLQNRELELDLSLTQARYEEISARLLKAMNGESADMKPLAEMRDSVSARLKKLTDDAAKLVITARHDGVWVAPGIEEYVGRWMPRGSDLGLLVNSDGFEFAATVMQDDVDALFAQKLPRAEVQLYGDVGAKLKVGECRVIPGAQKILPSAVLGWRGGGEVPVSLDDNAGNRASEPFFQVVGRIDPTSPVSLLDGRTGKIRFKLEPEPLLQRWFRRLWQLFQKRYQI
jgi:putative peptide zinc metalloprotease protein